MHSWCHPRLTALRRVLDALWTQRACLPLRAAPTSWWSRVAAGRLGPRSSIDVWLSKLADSPEKSSTRQRWRGAPERVVLSKGIACIRFKELIARLRVRTIYCISCLAWMLEERRYPTFWNPFKSLFGHLRFICSTFYVFAAKTASMMCGWVQTFDGNQHDMMSNLVGGRCFGKAVWERRWCPVTFSSLILLCMANLQTGCFHFVLVGQGGGNCPWWLEQIGRDILLFSVRSKAALVISVLRSSASPNSMQFTSLVV